MQKTIIKTLIFILINVYTKSFAQWQSIYPDTNGILLPELVSVFFINYNNGMAASYDNIIIRTTDSGLNWDTVLFLANPTNFQQITFSNDSTAFAVGSTVFPMKGIIAKTIDFGNTWDTTLTFSDRVYSVSFTSDSIGYAVGTGGTILKTSDAGGNWIVQNSMVVNPLYSVYFLNDSFGFACGDSIILKTNDGGNNWSNMNIGGAFSNGFPYTKIFFPSDSIGYYMKSEGAGFTYLYKTINSGLSWNFHSALTLNETYRSMFFTNDTTGYIMGFFSMNKTTDGGTTWNEQNSTPTPFLNEMQSVFFLNNDTGFAVGPQQFHKTTKGGECVIPANFSITDSLITVSFYDSTFNSTSWLWDFGNGDTSTLQYPIHTYDSAGIYNVCLTSTSICDTVTICDSVTVFCPRPISLFGYTDSLLTVSFADSSTGVTSWMWDFGDGDTDTIQNPTHIYQNPGTYMVILIAGNVCGSDTFMRSVTVNVLGISELVLNYFKLYPNPNNGNFQIDYQLPVKQDGAFVIYDVIGRKLKTWQLAGGKNKLYITDIELKNGLYFYQVIVNDGLIKSNKLLIINNISL